MPCQSIIPRFFICGVCFRGIEFVEAHRQANFIYVHLLLTSSEHGTDLHGAVRGKVTRDLLDDCDTYISIHG